MKKLFSNKYFRYSLLVAAGIFLGYLFFHSRDERDEKKSNTEQITKNTTIWTCSMHPQIRMDHPGKCPICGMDLIPLEQAENEAMDPSSIRLTKEAAELANVQTSVVSHQEPVKEVRLYGKVQADERNIQSQISQFPGRIEKLLISFTGEIVHTGQPLAIIYSPNLITAQQELLETTAMKKSQPEIYQAAREKLRQWKLTDQQIDNIEISGKVSEKFEILSTTEGIVMTRRVNNGDHVNQGTVLFDVADLSDLWIMFDAYESDLPFLNIGDRMNFTVQAFPGMTYSGRISFIDPVINPVTRVAKVRVEVKNKSDNLKPEMFVTGIARTHLDNYSDNFIIPRSAVLWTGKRSVVYVKQLSFEDPVFKMREVELGPSLGDSYIVLNGLYEGEEIVTQGTFSVDAAAQLEGKPSMMNTEGGRISSMPGMTMPGDSRSDDQQSMSGMDMPDDTLKNN
jgi:Cu(I)/Ag(I) efflux system membrane fusion protein